MALNFETTNVTHLHGSSWGRAGAAAFIIQLKKKQDPGGSLDELHAHYWLETHTTFKTVSFCLIAKVLAASRSAQLLQMLSCDSQIPLYLLQAPESVLTTPTDVSLKMCAYLKHGAKKWEHKVVEDDREESLPLSCTCDLVSQSNIWLDS